MDRAELQQQRVLFRVAHMIVQQDDLGVEIFDQRPQNQLADPAQSVELQLLS